MHIRGERWRVLGQHPHALCSVLEVAGTDPSNRGAMARFILPFERALPLSSHDECPRIARAPALRHAMRRALATATPTWTCLRAAANAHLSLLPFQLEPAIAMTRGISPRILLADAVGLGKTIQAGLILVEIRAREPDARTLIVTPAGLREQWRDELAERFAIAAMVPARAVTTHTLFVLRTVLPHARQLVLCALLNSYVANYLIRMRVNTHVTALLMARLPVPVPAPGGPSERLAFLAEVCLSAASPVESMEEYAELQARAARLYGVREDEFRHVLSTFPLVPQDVKSRSLAHFDNLRSHRREGDLGRSTRAARPHKTGAV